MFALTAYLQGLVAILVLAVIAWSVSVARRNVTLVDSIWGLFFALAAVVYLAGSSPEGPRAWLVLILVLAWSGRWSGHLTWRNWRKPEDRRYQAIRRNNEPNFAIKSLYLVFGLQGLLAWLISLPLLAAITGATSLSFLDYAGIALWSVGMLFETYGDWQLARFQSQVGNAGRVMNRGLWRYTRHPNYFGEFCIWWGYYLLAVAAGGWWSVLSPLLMTFLLFKVSGVAMLERDIASRRPAYRDYVQRTNTFFPGPPRRPAGLQRGSATP